MLTATAGCGALTADVSAVESDSKPALFVIESKRIISQETMARIQHEMSQMLEHTPFAGAQVVVLAEGLTLTVLGSDGRVLNERLTEQA